MKREENNIIVDILLFAYGTDPVKLMPAKCVEAVIVSPKTGPSAGIKFTTPAGTPASRIILNITQFERTAVSDGFHKTELPCTVQYRMRLVLLLGKL